jgi:transposase
MDKSTAVAVAVFAGIDVSARELVVAVGRGERDEEVVIFANTAVGHRQLLRHLLGKRDSQARVALEASGNYSLDLCLTLEAEARVELSVVNPRQARRFAESLGKRSKTDPVDARVLREHARRMPCVAWPRPSGAALKLRAITRAIEALTKVATQQRNRQHALGVSEALPAVVGRELRRHQQSLEKCRCKLEQQAVRLIAGEAELSRRFALLQSTCGFGLRSALAVVGELATLPAGLDARQWVAHSGLDPRQVKSGTSVEQKPRISKVGNRRLRRALYMPALVAVRHQPHVRAFYERLVNRGKTKLQALTAVMRKLLHAIHAMFRTDQVFDGAKLCPPAAAAQVV